MFGVAVEIWVWLCVCHAHGEFTGGRVVSAMEEDVVLVAGPDEDQVVLF